MTETRVEGIDEALSAFKDFGKGLDFPKIAEDAAEAIIPDVRSFTRYKSGALQQGWDIQRDEDGAAFINSQEYMGFQEWGTDTIEPTHAVYKAWDSNQEQVVKAYDEAVKEVAEGAGFEQ